MEMLPAVLIRFNAAPFDSSAPIVKLLLFKFP